MGSIDISAASRAPYAAEFHIQLEFLYYRQFTVRTPNFSASHNEKSVLKEHWKLLLSEESGHDHEK